MKTEIIFFLFFLVFAVSQPTQYGTLLTNVSESDYKCLNLIGGDFKLCYLFSNDTVEFYLNAKTSGYVAVG